MKITRRLSASITSLAVAIQIVLASAMMLLPHHLHYSSHSICFAITEFADCEAHDCDAHSAPHSAEDNSGDCPIKAQVSATARESQQSDSRMIPTIAVLATSLSVGRADETSGYIGSPYIEYGRHDGFVPSGPSRAPPSGLYF